jgi:phosphoglycerate dehydrogenase-like enzyme
MTRVAILDDYQNCALEMADWSKLPEGSEVVSFTDHLTDEDEIAARLAGFDVVMVNRERTPFSKSQLAKLPDLKLLLTAGMRNAALDIAAANAQGIVVCGAMMVNTSTPELTWGIIHSVMRHLPTEDRNVREGRWQTTVGKVLSDKVLGVIGLGRLGIPVSQVALAFGMDVIAWSPNLTDDRAAEHGVTRVDKGELFRQADIITIHMPLSERSRGLVGADDIALMKPTAYLINTSRGPIVDETALIDALEKGKIAGAGLDVYDIEPLPADHPLRRLPNTVVTPHIGYVTEESYRLSFAESIENIEAWLAGAPIRVIEP